ncbi:MAG: hypothetical protein H0V45_12935 [Actinobacteria bacterium]|nr:hypothetical protein [Actinomycetota bacterium]
MTDSALPSLEDLIAPPVEEARPRQMVDFRPTDLGNAERLVAQHGRDLRFAPGLGWFAWDGRRWKRDTDGEPIRRAKQVVRAMYAEAAVLADDARRALLIKWATTSESESRLRATVKLAETERAVIVEPNQLDADGWLFNASNGTIDLRTGELREHRREDLLTRLTTVVYKPDAGSDPTWESFLARIAGGNEELIGFLQRATGYSLTGHTGEEVLSTSTRPRSRRSVSTFRTASGRSSR